MAESNEAAFLASMKAANEEQGMYEEANGAGAGAGAGAATESYNTSDEYDPAQAVPNVQSLHPTAQESSLHQTPPTALLNEAMPLSTVSDVSSTVLPTAPDPSAGNGPDHQSESRSMSRATSSDISQTLIPDQISTAPPPARAEKTSNIAADGHRTNQGVANNLLASPSIGLNGNVAVPTTSNSSAEHGSAPTTQKIDRLISANTILSAAGDPALLEGATESPADTMQNVPKDSATPSTTRDLAAATSTLPKARLPHDIIGILEDRIQEDPRGDMDAWLSLIGEFRRRCKLDEARNVYERFFAIFPAAAEQWVAYAQMENEAQNRNGMERVFQRTLLQIPYLPLWSLYLDHIRRLNNLTTDTSGNARNTIYQAYDLALQQIGLDKNSGQLWQDFIEFIKSGPGIAGGSGWQDQQKMDQLRKIYQRAICVPTQSTNLLWKEYDKFERGLNAATGPKFLQDQSPAYMSARSSYTALQKITQNLRQTTLAMLPPALGFAGYEEFVEQLDTWKRWIQWEKEDPLVLKQEDVAAYRARIIFVYKQAFMAMRFWPELWCDASEFCFSNDMETEGNEFLVAGIAANPESCLLAFKRADRLEISAGPEEGDESTHRRAAAVREAYIKVLDAFYELLTKSKIQEEHDIARVEAEIDTAKDSPQTNGVKEEEEEDEDVDPNNEANITENQKLARISAVKSSNAAQVRLLSRTLSHVWIACMRAMRRIGGKATFRATFGDARKRGRLTSEVYVAVALIEYHCYEPDTARKIFDRGLKLFQDDDTFALAYIKHLVANNDHTNARVTFETAVTRLEKKAETVSKTKPLYIYFHDFESRYGELTQMVKLEKRMRDLFPEDPSLSLFSSRFTDQGFDPTAIRPVVSASQSQPKVLPSVETTVPDVDQIIQQVTQGAPNVHSPKRHLSLDDCDTDAGRPQKFQRASSPLKGAAGRRSDQQKRSQLPVDPPFFQQQQHGAPPHPLPPPPLPRDVTFLLSIIPRADTYTATKFKPSELVRLIRETHIPNNVSQLPQQGAAGRGPPAHPPQLQHHIPQIAVHQAPPIMQQRPPMPPLPPGPPIQYGQYGQPNNQFSGVPQYQYNR